MGNCGCCGQVGNGHLIVGGFHLKLGGKVKRNVGGGVNLLVGGGVNLLVGGGVM